MEKSPYPNFTIIITTCNRLTELRYTLTELQPLLTKGSNGIICDDGSEDSTSEFVREHFPKWKLIRNAENKGLIYSRNRLMKMVNTPYAVSLDDDANFLGNDPIPLIFEHFKKNLACGVSSFRVYWGKEIPTNLKTVQRPERIKSYLGGAHAWRMSAWRDIHQYPSWFVFYGEEEFASYQLFKKGREVHYLPEVLVHHRVNVKERRFEDGYTQRLRRSLRAGWYLYLIFSPLKLIPRKLAYSIWNQLKLKIFKGDLKALKALFLAIGDLVLNLRKIINSPERLTMVEYESYQEIADTKIYWSPDDRQKEN